MQFTEKDTNTLARSSNAAERNRWRRENVDPELLANPFDITVGSSGHTETKGVDYATLYRNKQESAHRTRLVSELAGYAVTGDVRSQAELVAERPLSFALANNVLSMSQVERPVRREEAVQRSFGELS